VVRLSRTQSATSSSIDGLDVRSRGGARARVASATSRAIVLTPTIDYALAYDVIDPAQPSTLYRLEFRYPYRADDDPTPAQ